MDLQHHRDSEMTGMKSVGTGGIFRAAQGSGTITPTAFKDRFMASGERT